MRFVPREVRENVARAIGYLQRDATERALLTMGEALRAMAGMRLPTPEQEELHSRINAFLDALAGHAVVGPLLNPEGTGRPPSFRLQAGKEAALATVLCSLARIVRREAQQPVRQEAEAQWERKRQLLSEGMAALGAGQPRRGLAFLQRLVDEFGHEEGVRVQMGHILSAAGLPAEAARMYESAMAVQPKEPAAYTGAANAWMEVGEYASAERVYTTALRVFGGHPTTFGNMATMYLAWGKRQEAEEAAHRALQADPLQPEALAVLSALESS